jgi:hypothetical protein
MPGPYAHITLLHELRSSGRFETIFQPSFGCADLLTTYFSYVLLGAISPDYPNLSTEDSAASRWADVMHCTRACEMITSGIRHIRESSGAVRDKQMAWLLGYASHVAADVTIHPIVQAKVGVYAKNQRHHRICEMNQDSFIYHRMNLGEIGESDDFAVAITRCSNPADRTQLDSDITTLWERMLEDVHPELYSVHRPDCASWHKAFITMVDDSRTCSVRLFPLAAVIAAKIGLAYPVYKKAGRQFVTAQTVPSGKPYVLDYDDIFDQAADSVVSVWQRVGQAFISNGSEEHVLSGDWNLDTGRDEQGNLVFWD